LKILLMRESDPPRFAIKFLHWFCPPELVEGIEGDLNEQYQSERMVLGDRKARRKFVWRTLCFFRLSILLRNRFKFHFNIRHYYDNFLKRFLRLCNPQAICITVCRTP